MSGFPIGLFDRDAFPGALRGMCPQSAVDGIVSVDPESLWKLGKRLVLLDVDNTLLPWRGRVIPDGVQAWVERARAQGLKMCILSNTRHPERLAALAGQLGVPFRRGRFKPSTRMYLAALEEFETSAEQAVMIGDQLFTDVLGANRAGIDAIWVRPMTGRDFIGTKLSRLGERLLRPLLKKALRPSGAVGQNGAMASAPMLQRPVVRQFLKFCAVGGTSTVIDLGIHYVLMFRVHVGDELLSAVFGRWALELFGNTAPSEAAASQLSFTVFKVLSASIAILNSFIWNRRWTFRIRGKEDRHRQLVKFVIVAVLGMVLNASIASGLNSVIAGHPKRSWAIASAVATVVVAFWNFAGQKLWTFRQKRP